MNNVNVISVQDFRKTYGEVVAVSGISFEVHQGEIFGPLGPNGARAASASPPPPPPSERKPLLKEGNPGYTYT